MIVAFTGNRPKLLPWGSNESHPLCVELKRLLTDTVIDLINEGADTFLCGMAMGVDTYCAEIVLELKKQYDIKLICVIPSSDQPLRWRDKDKERYKKILDRSDDRVLISLVMTSDSNKRRNYYMVEHCDCLIAVWNGFKRSGTYQTLAYATRFDKRIISIDTKTLQLSTI